LGLAEFLTSMFGKDAKAAAPPPDLSDPSALFDRLMKGGCPDCGSHEFLEGPSGGASTNIKCANELCGSKFNVTGGGFNIAERISEPCPDRPTRECPRCHSKRVNKFCAQCGFVYSSYPEPGKVN
jgi:hypothetical protein